MAVNCLTDFKAVTILILIDGFLQSYVIKKVPRIKKVTILILIDGFLQCEIVEQIKRHILSHNPYFNRWFSAIKPLLEDYKQTIVTILILIDGFLQ